MSKIKRMLAALLAASMLVTVFASCGDSEESSGETSQGGEESSGLQAADVAYGDDMDLSAIAEQYDGETISIWAWWGVGTDEQKKMDVFTEKTGVTFDWQILTYEEYFDQVVTAVSGGGGPDIGYLGEAQMPTWALKNIILPISDYMDFNDLPFELSPSGKEAYSFNGKTYCLVDGNGQTHKMFYRKSAFRNMGVEDPLDVFNRGEWTWNKFVEMGREITYDSDGDGAVDKYAYWAWPRFQWFSSNGTNTIGFDESGMPYFAMGEPAAMESIQFIRDLTDTGAYKIQAPWMMDHDPQQDLIAGRTAMDYSGDWSLGDLENEGYRSQIGEDLGFVPCPVGPSYTGEAMMADYGSESGEFMGAGSSHPELVAIWLQFKRLPLNAETEAEDQAKAAELELYKYGDEAGIELSHEMAKHGVYDLALGYGKLGTIVDNILNDTASTPAQALEANRAAAENQINKTMEDAASVQQ